jgi:SAM-dependent methyltransferase
MDLVEARATGSGAVVRHPWERARLSLAQDLIRRHVSLRAGDAVLDIGCGDTFVCEALARRYPEVHFYAVDNAFTNQQIAALRGRLTVPNVSLFASLDAVPLAGPAALVLLMDVIEHVPDDVAFLGDICRRPAVGSDTWFLMTVPSFQSLFSSHDRFLGHYRRYTVRSFRQLFSQMQLQSAEEGYFFATLLPLRFLQLLKERIAGSPQTFAGLAGWRGSESMSQLIASLLTLEGRLTISLARAGLKIPGLSNFALCRKSA